MADAPIDQAAARRLSPGDRIRHEGGAEFVLLMHRSYGWWELDSGRVLDDQLTNGEWFLVEPPADR